MRENRAKQKLRNGQIVTVTSGHQSSDMIDFLGPLGFDAMWIETEHGPVSWEQIGDMSRACDLWGMSSIVRVNANEPWLITRRHRHRRATCLHQSRSGEGDAIGEVRPARVSRHVRRPALVWRAGLF